MEFDTYASTITTKPGVISRGDTWERSTMAVPIVEKLPERTETAFPMLTVSGSTGIRGAYIMDGIGNHYPAKTALDCRIFAYTI